MSRTALSIVDAFAERERFERQAKMVWEQLAERLMALIPDGLHTFANEKGWIKGETYKLDGYWPLPEWLQFMVTNTRAGGCNSDKYREDDLEIYGFESFDDLRAKFEELEAAWNGLIRIEVDDGEGYRVEVCYYATEVTPTTN